MKRDSVIPAAGLATSLACAMNALLFSVGQKFGADFNVMPSGLHTRRALDVIDVTAATAVVMLAGTVLYIVLERFSPQRAWRIWWVTSALVFVVSIVPHHTHFNDAPHFILTMMHVTPALALFAVIGATRR